MTFLSCTSRKEKGTEERKKETEKKEGRRKVGHLKRIGRFVVYIKKGWKGGRKEEK